MKPLPVLRCDRRLWLMIVLVLLGAAAGFVRGQAVGYGQGKADTIQAIDEKLLKLTLGKLPA